jgi:UDPglucose 6-dehydrogenase
MSANVGFIGLGKLGLDSAEVFADHYSVRGYDIEPRQSATVQVTDIANVVKHSDWIFVAVPTPHGPGYDGSTPSSHMSPRDFAYDTVIDAIEMVNQHADTAKKVVIISTVLPGTVRREFAPRLHQQHQLIYNPYLIAMGSVKWDMVNPEMIMIGTDHGDHQGLAQELVELYRPMMQNDPRYEIGTWEECEAIKIFYNTFISAKLGLANMIQDFAQRIGNIDVDRVTDALARSTQRIMGPKYMTAGMGDAGACHPRDNIALRWLAQQHDIGYDLFDTIMLAREQQARNLARFLFDQATTNKQFLPIVIHGKAYKPDVPYCIGSYSTLIGHYLKELGIDVKYLDPLADDPTDVVAEISQPCVLLMAHNRSITYGYTGNAKADIFYCEIPPGSIIVDPWRRLPKTYSPCKVIHYGNTRQHV